jgi:hypothetical protein
MARLQRSTFRIPLLDPGALPQAASFAPLALPILDFRLAKTYFDVAKSHYVAVFNLPCFTV